MTTKTAVSVESVAGQFGLAEGPHWDHNSQKLYFVEIFKQKIHKLDPATGASTSAYVENGPLGVAVPVDGMPDKLVAGTGTDFILVTWDGEKNVTKCPSKKLTTVDTDRVETRWNDGKVDSSGRFWGGTMGLEKDRTFPPNQGSLYCISHDFKAVNKVSPVTISNGLAWSLEDDMFYYIDSPTCQIEAYNYNPQTGDISNKKVIFDLKTTDIPGFPDGMTIDRNGNLWVAVYGGECVIEVNPRTGEMMRSVTIPAKNVTSVAFGGPDLDILYVTTSSHGLTEAEHKDQPLAGHIFAVKGLGVRGLTANSFKLNA